MPKNGTSRTMDQSKQGTSLKGRRSQSLMMTNNATVSLKARTTMVGMSIACDHVKR